MEEEDPSNLTIREIRERMHRRLTINNGNGVLPSASLPVRVAPSIPKHRLMSHRPSEPNLSPPPIPIHGGAGAARKLSHGYSSSLLPPHPNRIKKPKIAPKPKLLTGDWAGSAPSLNTTTSDNHPAPLITVECVEAPSSSGIEQPRRDSSSIVDRPDISEDFVLDGQHVLRRTGTVRERTQAWNEKGLGIVIQPRPLSTVSTSSLTSRDTDVEFAAEAKETDSDLESESDRLENGERLEKLKRNSSTLGTEGRIIDRRPSSIVNGDSKLHEKIMDELRMCGVLRENRRRTDTNSNTEHPNNREKRETTLSAGSDEVSVSKRSSSTTTEDTTDADTDRHSKGEVIEYNTGDEEEDKRLKKLHHSVLELCTVQEKFVKYLEDMGEVYPQYLHEWGRRKGREVIPNGTIKDTQLHPVLRMQSLLLQLIPTHKQLFSVLDSVCEEWDSRQPCLADKILQYADFLKTSKPFIKAKPDLLEEISALRNHNRDFYEATTMFEVQHFGRGVGAVTQQLDQVHQNFLRYKMLMDTYNKYLPDGIEEKEKTKQAIAKLLSIADSMNKELNSPAPQELLELNARFQGGFNVFNNGGPSGSVRRLIRHGPVLKQNRKEPQPRYLVLVSDILWICRESGRLGSAGLFDMPRSYDLRVEKVIAAKARHDENDDRMEVLSDKKSCILILSSSSERDAWIADINEAHRRRKEVIDRTKKTNRARRESVASMSNHEAKSTSSTDGNRNSVAIDENPMEYEDGGESSHDEEQGNEFRELDLDSVQATWIEDNSSTRCMMQGCDTVFGFINRRHHCRDCGWLICSNCAGKAPIPKSKFRKELTCPECYDRIESQYSHGTLFPESVLRRREDNPREYYVYVERKGKAPKLYEPRYLFEPPRNRRLKKMNLEARIGTGDRVVGKVVLRQAKGKEVNRYAVLSDDVVLKFYVAKFDQVPSEHYIIHGYTLREYDDENNRGRWFDLRHKNLLKTERGEDAVVFKVETEKMANKWSEALQSGLRVSSENEENGQVHV